MVPSRYFHTYGIPSMVLLAFVSKQKLKSERSQPKGPMLGDVCLILIFIDGLNFFLPSWRTWHDHCVTACNEGFNPVLRVWKVFNRGAIR
jgi:hypothetical protein